MSHKHNLKKYDLSMEDLARMFGYSSANSLSGSTRREQFLKGVQLIISHVENKIVQSILEQKK